MFTFFSQMAKTGLLDSYSAVRLEFLGREMQTLSYELFDDQKDWMVDFKKYQKQLTQLHQRKT